MQMQKCVRLGMDSISFPGWFVVEEPIAELADRGYQIVSLSQRGAGAAYWSRATKHG